MFRKRSTHYNRGLFGVALASLLALVSHADFAGAQTASPTLVGGSPNGRQVVPVLTDSSGRIYVVGSSAGGTVYGPDAANTPGTQSPLRVAGSSSATSNSGTVFNWVVDSFGNGAVTGTQVSGSSTAGKGFLTGGFDGSFYRNFSVDSSGRLGVNIIGSLPAGSASIGNVTAQGMVAAGGANAGNPVKTGCLYATTLPTLTNGTDSDSECDTNGNLRTAPTVSSPVGSDGNANFIGKFATNGAQNSYAYVGEYGFVYNGSTWDRQRAIAGADGSGLGVSAVAQAPNSSAGSAIIPVVSSALESGHVLKASAGNLYRLRYTVTSGGYVLTFNATTVPADGAVVPQSCTQVSPGTGEIDHADAPDRYTTGISVAFSSTGCFTKTAASAAMFEGSVQ